MDEIIERSSGDVVKKKVNLIGTQGVGKTSLILRFVKHVFGEEYLKTIGTNVYKKSINMEGDTVELIIHDIMGEEAYRSVQEGAFIGSTGALAVIDITRPETLDTLVEKWIPRYKSLTDENNPILLAVNKFDLPNREISTERLNECSKDFEMVLFTSAKTGKNVNTAFDILASRVAQNLQLGVDDIEDLVSANILDTPQKLLDALLAFASELGNLPYETRERILVEAGIEKFDMDEMIEEMNEVEVFNFAAGLSNWYQDAGETYAYRSILGLIEKYKKDTAGG